jgi:hypothetical protein
LECEKEDFGIPSDLEIIVLLNASISSHMIREPDKEKRGHCSSRSIIHGERILLDGVVLDAGKEFQ